LLRVVDFAVRFPTKEGEVQALRGVNLALDEGESLALIGESGSGKTLTALGIVRLLPPNARVNGRIGFYGTDLLGLPDDRMRGLRGQKIAMIFEQPTTCLNPILTVGAQIVEALRVERLSSREARSRAVDLLAETGIPDPHLRFSQFPFQLSGGMQQRAMIAMALAGKPRLLIADEPTTALDPRTRDEIVELLRSSVKRMGSALLLLTHDHSVATALCRRVAVMQSGTIVEQGASELLLRSPRHSSMQRAAYPSRNERPILNVESLAKAFSTGLSNTRRTIALKSASLDIRQGETVGLMGESGSGKTTLARCILRLIEPDSGDVFFDGMDWLALRRGDLRRVRSRMQAVFQDPDGSLPPRMRVRDLLTEPFVISGELCSNTGPNVEALLDSVLLGTEVLDRFPHELSGGQRQRVGIARALALRPKLIVLDEPTASLDYAVRQQIVVLLREIQESRGVSYLLISHDPDLVTAMAHRVYRIDDGSVCC
jgi:ABC-type glutathione transport system ATPase component